MNTEPPARKSRISWALVLMARGVVLLLLVLILGVMALAAVAAGSDYVDAWQTGKKRDRIAAAVDALALKSDSVTLYSLQYMKLPNGSSSAKGDFHGYPIRGQKEISEPGEKEKLIALLAEDIRLKKDRWQTQCFAPRHGLRITAGTEVCDFVICFSCRNAEAHGFGDDEYFNLSGYAKAEYNAALDLHGLKREMGPGEGRQLIAVPPGK